MIEFPIKFGENICMLVGYAINYSKVIRNYNPNFLFKYWISIRNANESFDGNSKLIAQKAKYK